MNEDNAGLYANYAAELDAGTHDAAIWQRALEFGAGDETKARTLYGRMRALDQRRAAEAPPVAPKTPERSDLSDLRARLAAALDAARRPSLYNALGLRPTCDDAAVARKVTELMEEARHSGRPLDAERKYAMNIIGNPAARERYDTKLWRDVAEIDPGESWQTPAGTFSSWWGSGKVAALVAAGIFVALGYLFIAERDARNARANEKARLELQRESADAGNSNDMRRLDNQRFAIEQGARLADRHIDTAAENRQRALALQEERERAQRAQQEQRAYIEMQRLEMEQQRDAERTKARQEALDRQARKDEERRIDREKKYWACMNNALNRHSYDRANSACAMYK